MIFFTRKPNLIFSGGWGEGEARVSDFFLLSVQIWMSATSKGTTRQTDQYLVSLK